MTGKPIAAQQQELIIRLRTLLADEPTLREVTMFGGRSFMINEKMIVSALQSGNLLVRTAADDHEELITRPGAGQAEMGRGRSMGPGWIEVEAAALADGGLSHWLGIALDHNHDVTS